MRSSLAILTVLLVMLGGVLAGSALAQEEHSAVTASALVIPEGNVSEGEASIASIGLRRGISHQQ